MSYIDLIPHTYVPDTNTQSKEANPKFHWWGWFTLGVLWYN
jgi:hypothetical protein